VTKVVPARHRIYRASDDVLSSGRRRGRGMRDAVKGVNEDERQLQSRRLLIVRDVRESLAGGRVLPLSPLDRSCGVVPRVRVRSSLFSRSVRRPDNGPVLVPAPRASAGRVVCSPVDAGCCDKVLDDREPPARSLRPQSIASSSSRPATYVTP